MTYHLQTKNSGGKWDAIFFLMNRIISAWSGISLFLLSFTICDTELNSLSLSTLLHGAERYLHAILAREGNRTLLTSQYCRGLSLRAIVASPRYVSSCAVSPTAAGVSATDACSFAISSNMLSKLLLASSLRGFRAGGSSWMWSSCWSSSAVSLCTAFAAVLVFEKNTHLYLTDKTLRVDIWSQNIPAKYIAWNPV